MRVLLITCDTTDNLSDHLANKLHELISNNMNIAENGEICITSFGPKEIQEIVAKHVAIVQSKTVSIKEKELIHAIDFIEATCGNPKTEAFTDNLFRYTLRIMNGQLDQTTANRMLNAMEIVVKNAADGNLTRLSERNFNTYQRKIILNMYNLIKQCKTE